tara:strand:+ start:2190 stop:2756 length:567 start_codon:yes stop_codon:yes gene_type:complete
MGTIREDFRCLLVENFLSVDICRIFSNYAIMRHRVNKDNQIDTVTNNIHTSHYGDKFSESILLYCKDKMEKLTNKKLFPTYSYWRMYTYGSYLKEHKDRNACEISATIHVDGDKDDWPIIVGEKEYFTKPGDAVIYLGIEDSHSRKKFEGDFQTQIFLHYVDQEGPYKDYLYDKRIDVGVSNADYGVK